jgi:hypothetical protein
MRRLPPGEKIDLKLNSTKISIRIYSDSRPHVLQTARLQKGVVLVRDGIELVEEGLGLGIPICRYRDGTRFSLNATTCINDSEANPTIIKVYDMNGKAAKMFRGVSIRRETRLSHFIRSLERVYQNFHRLRRVKNLTLDVVSLVGLTSEYMTAYSRGQIAVTYRLTGNGLLVQADFTNLSQDGLQAVIFGNEQGGRIFDSYSDSDGTRLKGREIEPWKKTAAKCASLNSARFGVRFGLSRTQGWEIVMGREVIRNRISWCGLNLLRIGAPDSLEYNVEIQETAN